MKAIEKVTRASHLIPRIRPEALTLEDFAKIQQALS